MPAEQGDNVKMLTDRISPILHGHSPVIQGAVLAELLATWLAGHVVPGDRMQTILVRGRLFHEHMKVVRDLMKLNAMRIKLEDFQGSEDLSAKWVAELPANVCPHSRNAASEGRHAPVHRMHLNCFSGLFASGLAYQVIRLR